MFVMNVYGGAIATNTFTTNVADVDATTNDMYLENAAAVTVIGNTHA